MPGTSLAQPPVRFVCGFGPTTGANAMVRFLAESMRPMLGGSIEVENVEDVHGDYEGNVATEVVARSAPDGRTIYITAGALVAANCHLLERPTVDARELEVFGTITRPPNTLIVAADSPYRTLEELTTAMMEKGDAARFGVPNGSVVRVVAALYQQLSRIPTVPVIYPVSTQVVRDLLAGTLEFGFSNNAYSADQQRLGNVRILAVSLAERLVGAAEYPTFTEYGYPVAVDGWWGGFVAPGTPRPIVDRLGEVLAGVLMKDETREFFRSTICDPWIQTPDDAQAHFREQISVWGEYVRLAELPKQSWPPRRQPTT